MFVIKAYVGGFYLREDVSSENALGNVERRLKLHYFHAIPATDFAEATTEMIKKMYPRIDFLRYSPKF